MFLFSKIYAVNRNFIFLNKRNLSKAANSKSLKSAAKSLTIILCPRFFRGRKRKLPSSFTAEPYFDDDILDHDALPMELEEADHLEQDHLQQEQLEQDQLRHEQLDQEQLRQEHLDQEELDQEEIDQDHEHQEQQHQQQQIPDVRLLVSESEEEEDQYPNIQDVQVAQQQQHDHLLQLLSEDEDDIDVPIPQLYNIQEVLIPEYNVAQEEQENNDAEQFEFDLEQIEDHDDGHPEIDNQHDNNIEEDVHHDEYGNGRLIENGGLPDFGQNYIERQANDHILLDHLDEEPEGGGNQGNDEYDLNGMDYQSLLEDLYDKWMTTELDHTVSKIASNSFWSVAFQYIPKLMEARQVQQVTKKVPTFNHIRRKLHAQKTPDVNLEIAYKSRETQEVMVVNEASAPKKRFPGHQYEKLYEVASVKVHMHELNI